MARKSSSGGGTLKVSVEGLSRAAEIPHWLEHGQQEALERGAKSIVDDLQRAAPGQAIARSIVLVPLTATRVVIEVHHPGGKALAKGAFIRPRVKKALRFTVGGRVVITRRPVRLQPTGWDKRGLRRKTSRIREAYAEVFSDLDSAVT